MFYTILGFGLSLSFRNTKNMVSVNLQKKLKNTKIVNTMYIIYTMKINLYIDAPSGIANELITIYSFVFFDFFYFIYSNCCILNFNI